jgi:hypothetical protein
MSVRFRLEQQLRAQEPAEPTPAPRPTQSGLVVGNPTTISTREATERKQSIATPDPVIPNKGNRNAGMTHVVLGNTSVRQKLEQAAALTKDKKDAERSDTPVLGIDAVAAAAIEQYRRLVAEEERLNRAAGIY